MDNIMNYIIIRYIPFDSIILRKIIPADVYNHLWFTNNTEKIVTFTLK